MLNVEFHCHTNASGDSLVQPADLVKTCRDRGIDRVVVTDHNSIQGALAAQRLAPDMVIVGEEVMTTVGELLCAFVREEVPAGLTPAEAIARLKDQGAFISVSHPFDRTRAPWFSEALDEIASDIDAIEIFNARCLLPSYNRDAATYARQRGLAGTVGSDAHLLTELGRTTIVLPEFEDADGLRAAISEARYETRRTGLLARLGSRYAVYNKGRKK